MRRGETKCPESELTASGRWYRQRKDDPVFREQFNAKKRAERAALSREERKARADRYKRTPSQRKMATEWMKRDNRRRRAKIEALKTAPCLDCGLCFPPYMMDFDHRPGATKTGPVTGCVGYLVTRAPIIRTLEEISKCDLVCSNCHRKRTHERRPPPMEGGKYASARRWRARRRALLCELKSVPCADCGTRYESCVMDFDHRPGTQKEGTVGRFQVTHERLLREIAKCDVVCSNCHRGRTHRRRNHHQ